MVNSELIGIPKWIKYLAILNKNASSHKDEANITYDIYYIAMRIGLPLIHGEIADDYGAIFVVSQFLVHLYEYIAQQIEIVLI